MRHRGESDPSAPSDVGSDELLLKKDQAKKEEKKPESLLRKTVVRSVVGILMMIFFYLVLQLPHSYIAVLIVLAQMYTWNEVSSLRFDSAQEREIPTFKWVRWYFLLVSFVFFYKDTIQDKISCPSCLANYKQYSAFGVFSLYVAGFVAFTLTLREANLRYQIRQLTWVIFTIFLIVGQTHFSMAYLKQGIVWILLPHSLIIVNDISAYFFGISLGRKIINRPLFKLSPNKTWEGYFGAMLFTIVLAFFAAPLYIRSDWFICPAGLWNENKGCDVTLFPHGTVFQLTDYKVPVLNWTVSIYPLQIHAVIFALFASVIAPVGGFLASAVKRALNKKDFDTLFPGHGGFMDRVDCQLLMVSFVYMYLSTFIFSPPSPLQEIRSLYQSLSDSDKATLASSFHQRS
uniref:phosphatidate cytidylyltransferase n=1 Tax=Arcella intermedia TaxID=1963864 RepID=A0A6B2L5K6_9EUKA